MVGMDFCYHKIEDKGCQQRHSNVHNGQLQSLVSN